MINVLRRMLWKILGIRYYYFLKNQKAVYLDDFKYAEIGTGTYNNGAVVWKWGGSSQLSIGKYCSISNDVHFILDSGFHDLNKITNYPLSNRLFEKEEKVGLNNPLSKKRNEIESTYPNQKKALVIGDDVWIGAGARILPGVQIGNCSTVLAGAVVTKSFPPFSVIGGVPATLLHQKLQGEDLQQDFLKIAWWNWDKEKIKKNIDDFSLSFEDFIKKHSDSNTH